MKISRTLAVALAALTVFAANFAQAQQSYSNSWSSQSSWNSSWSTGPNGTHVSGNRQSSQQSNSTVTNGGRTTSLSQNHSQRSGFARGVGTNGAYNSQYAQQQGRTVLTDQRRSNSLYGSATQTRQISNQYNNRQGFTETLGANGYNVAGYNNRSGSTTTLNDIRGRDMFGRSFGQGTTQTRGFNQSNSFNGGINRYGQPHLNINRSGGTFNRGRQYGWGG